MSGLHGIRSKFGEQTHGANSFCRPAAFGEGVPVSLPLAVHVPADLQRVLNVTAISRGFPPLAAPGARVLILGTLPSQLSLQSGEYYGNPRNTFWTIMGRLVGAGPQLSYADRVARMTARHIAVWDVLSSSKRPGSLDSSIDTESAVPNDFAAFFGQQPNLGLICFNGQTAAKLFARLADCPVANNATGVTRITLPSTSPAHAAMSIDDKCRAWAALLPFVESA